MNKLKVVYLGTPDFSVPCLELLYNHSQIDLRCVVSMPDRPAGRGQHLKSPEVIDFSKKNKIKYFQAENINKEEKFLKEIEKEKIDIIIVLAFAQFLGQRILNIPKYGCFNIHTSLLPKYRGAAPIQYALLNGDQVTGVSIQKMVKKMDAGDIAISHSVSISMNETGGQLYTRLKFQAALSLNELIEKIQTNSIKFNPQNEDFISFAPTLKKNDGFLNFSNEDYETIKNKIRALDPWPGTFCYLDAKRMKVFSIETNPQTLEPGKTMKTRTSLLVGCLDKTISFRTIQIEGKKKSDLTAIINGIKENCIINPQDKL